jgi:small subunit ribosomal protein S9
LNIPGSTPALSLPTAGLPVRGFHWGLGRRKSAVARVRIAPGSGDFLVNGRPMTEFFPTLQMQLHALAPLKATATEGTYNIHCNVNGGGPVGQSGAVMLGLARALLIANPTLESILRDQSLLTRDSRMKERKKYGRRGARRGFQFSKR